MVIHMSRIINYQEARADAEFYAEILMHLANATPKDHMAVYFGLWHYLFCIPEEGRQITH